MRLTHETLLSYPGLNGVDALCHIRVYEEPGRLPVVIAGELDDNPGTTVMNGIEVVAHTIQHEILADGREFELVEHHPPLPGAPETVSFSSVHFEHRRQDEDPGDPVHLASTVTVVGAEQNAVTAAAYLPGDFREPSWHPIDDVEEYLGCPVSLWPDGEYTAARVGGPGGQRLRDEVAIRAKANADRLWKLLEGHNEPPKR